MPPPIALTVAGSDPSGGAGLQADVKTFHQHGCYGASVVTLVTVQNTQRVTRVEVLDPELVLEQLRAVVVDVPPAATKTGALGSAAVVRAVAELAPALPRLVVDPVMISKHGTPLCDEEARVAIAGHLLPHAALVTPNAHEAEALLAIRPSKGGRPVRTVADAREAARAIADRFGPLAVLVKGGHLEGNPIDVLLDEGGELHELHAPRIETPHTHGTGCTYAAAIVAGLAHGRPLVDAVRQAKVWLTEAIRTAPGIGEGRGPVNHLARIP
jgi:hydroxymethylpyrimidine/phosphomethylpyrimidine kinase